ncbi:MAG TPA: phosphotransferase, partial [Abditibacteriaceae bacterium]|nr:phosphotransferase [Abditibacteriaceae bacterium]
MLSFPDAALVQHDPALPGLALLFDPLALLAALRLRAPDNRSLRSVQSLQIAYIRYKPRTSCLIGYRAVAYGNAPRIMENEQTEKTDEAVVLCAVAHCPDADDKLQKATKKSVVEAVPKRVALEQGVVVSFFPDDRALPSLTHLVDRQTRVALLKKLLPQYPDLWNATPRVLAYKPARRCVLRLRNEEHPEKSVVLRFYTKSGFEASRGKARRFSSGGNLRFPQAVAKSTRHAALVMEWLPGLPLNRVLESSGESPDAACLAMEKVGAAWAQLHTRSGGRLPLRTRESEARALLAAARGAGAVWPPLARRATKLARLLSVRLNAQSFAPRAMHGDFYASQVLLPKNQSEPIVLLDLDEAACGDPALDLGNFVAHLELDVLRGLLPAQNAKDFCAALLTGYNRVAKNDAFAFGDISVATAVGLMRLTPEPFRTHQPQWPEQIEAILARIESLLESSTTDGLATSRKASSTPPIVKSSTRFDDLGAATSDGAMPFLVQA